MSFNNDFLFNKEFWLQKKGTAMDKIFAPSYANLFMAHIEESFFTSIGFRPQFYVRYLNDIFFTWTDTHNEMLLFLERFNNFHPSIKLTHTISQSEIDFLDMLLYRQIGKNTNRLGTKVSFQPTNTHRLLHKYSFHPKYTFQGIIKGQLIHYLRLCSDISQFHEA